MKCIHLRPVAPEKDFGEIAILISSQEDETTTEAGLREDYERNKGNAIRIMTAENEQGELLGFYWAFRDKVEAGQATFYLVVKPERREQGAGGRLYEDMLQAAAEAQTKSLRVSILDSCPEDRGFAERRGFREIRHQIGMELDLEAFDECPFKAILDRLQGEGFRFTSMEELGNTEEAQRKLYLLNDSAVINTMGQAVERAWGSFEDFQKSVCQSAWYKPGGQIVAIDTACGAWAAMSAITRMDRRDYAYNLFTGVDLTYRGRKLGQAVKVLALLYARSSLKVKIVRTHHNTKNLPMLAIDRKLGYRQLPGAFLMEKDLTNLLPPV